MNKDFHQILFNNFHFIVKCKSFFNWYNLLNENEYWNLMKQKIGIAIASWISSNPFIIEWIIIILISVWWLPGGLPCGSLAPSDLYLCFHTQYHRHCFGQKTGQYQTGQWWHHRNQDNNTQYNYTLHFDIYHYWLGL